MKAKLDQAKLFFGSLQEQLKFRFKSLYEEILLIIHKMQDLSTTNYDLGLNHLSMGNFLDAKFRLLFSIKLKNNFAQAYYHLARCYLYQLQPSEAGKLLNQALEIDPILHNAKQRLNLLNRNFQDSTISLEIIAEDADALAKNYETFMLDQLNYSAPRKLAEALSSLLIKEDRSFQCLDLGCGTGLAGAFLAEMVRLDNLVGVDISKRALALASVLQKGSTKLYSQTLNTDFCTLSVPKDKFDIIIACNSFGYAKDIESKIKNLNSFSKQDTLFGLIVLKAENADVELNYDYNCFSFGEEFLKKIFKANEWSVSLVEEFNMLNKNIKGLLIIATK